MFKTFEYRIYPTEKQKTRIAKHIENRCCNATRRTKKLLPLGEGSSQLSI